MPCDYVIREGQKQWNCPFYSVHCVGSMPLAHKSISPGSLLPELTPLWADVFGLRRFYPDSPATSQDTIFPKVPGGRGTKEFPVIRGQIFSIAVFIKLLKAMSLATSVPDPRGHILCQRGNPLSVLNAGNSMKPMKPHPPSIPPFLIPSLPLCMFVCISIHTYLYMCHSQQFLSLWRQLPCCWLKYSIWNF